MGSAAQSQALPGRFLDGVRSDVLDKIFVGDSKEFVAFHWDSEARFVS